MDKFLKDCNYYPRKDGGGILESKQHYSVLERSPFSSEHSFAAIFRCDPDLMVAREPVRERVRFLPPHAIKDFILEWHMKRIMYAGIIQFTQVNTDLYLSFSIFLLNHHRTYPI